MKKFLALTILLLFVSSLTVLAYKPIPSYKVPIQKTENFIEKNTTLNPDPEPKGKRDMLIQSSVTTSPKPSMVTVYVYSLDGRDVVGPYPLYSGQTIDVPIDERLWGCYVVGGDDHAYISVWIVETTLTVNDIPALLPSGVLDSFYNA